LALVKQRRHYREELSQFFLGDLHAQSLECASYSCVDPNHPVSVVPAKRR
jgi:hypothetical protein